MRLSPDSSRMGEGASRCISNVDGGRVCSSWMSSGLIGDGSSGDTEELGSGDADVAGACVSV